MRRTTKEEDELFHAALNGQQAVKKPAVKKPPKLEIPKPKAKPPPKTPGVDGNTARRLQRGEIAPDAKLDLHGMTESAAHRALTAFVQGAHRRGDRLVLVVTGKGGASPDPERTRGVLKTMVPRWLEEVPMRGLIAEKRWAHIRHGGEGALYIYLRKT
jgi:DNA-nicking Smr family endonuclease